MSRRAEGRACDACHRRLLPGERHHYFEEPDRGRRLRVVCPLCRRRAIGYGWVPSPDGAQRDIQVA